MNKKKQTEKFFYSPGLIDSFRLAISLDPRTGDPAEVTSPDDAVRQIESGMKVAQLLGKIRPKISSAAIGAEGGKDHADLGPIPPDIIR